MIPDARGKSTVQAFFLRRSLRKAVSASFNILSIQWDKLTGAESVRFSGQAKVGVDRTSIVLMDHLLHLPS